MLSISLILGSIKKLDRRLNLEYHTEHYMEPHNILQEIFLNVLPDSYKKAQEKMKQQTLEALLLNVSLTKGRMHSNLKINAF